MLDGFRHRIRIAAEELPRGLRIVLAIFGILMWVIGAQFLAADVAIPLASALGAESAGVLGATFLVAFGALLVAPFVVLGDWELGESGRRAGYILAMMAWFVAADAGADAAEAAFDLPYVPVVVSLFLLPFLVYTGYRLWSRGGDGDDAGGADGDG